MLAVFTLLLRGAQYSAAPANATQPLQLLQLTAHPQARCMDGTAGGFYVHMSRLGAAQTKWLLTLQGGGECVSAKCAAKAKSALGSSDHFPGSYEFWDEAKAHFADTSCTANPELCDYNQVFLPYCSQDLWTGQATHPSNNTSFFWHNELTATSQWQHPIDEFIKATVSTLRSPLHPRALPHLEVNLSAEELA